MSASDPMNSGEPRKSRCSKFVSSAMKLLHGPEIGKASEHFCRERPTR